MQSSQLDQSKYFAEASVILAAEGFGVHPVIKSELPIYWNGTILCNVTPHGGVTYRNEFTATPDREEAKERVYKISRTAHEYMEQLDHAQPLKAADLADGYKVLADYNGTVLAARESKYGVQFVTWDWDFDHKGLSHGHYYNNNYIGAKRDFAVRSGMIGEHQLLSDEQLTEVYRCIHETLDAQYPMPETRTKILRELSRQIEDGVPNLEELVHSSNASELIASENNDFLHMSQHL